MGILSRFKALFWSWLGRAAPEQPEDPQLSLDRLEQSRRDIRRNLVEVNAARLRAQAQQAVLDEVRAKEYLEVKQDILDRVQVLVERIGGLRDSLHRIDDLHSELATREAELKALESGQELTELETRIREDLLDNRKEQS